MCNYSHIHRPPPPILIKNCVNLFISSKYVKLVTITSEMRRSSYISGDFNNANNNNIVTSLKPFCRQFVPKL